jgi:serine/threonine protein kinase
MNKADQLDRLFTEALQKPRAVRHEFVQQACGTDHGLCRDLLSLLAAADESDEFLTTPALHRLAEHVAREGWALRPGDQVGAYTILRLLGSGGAGQVWCARDQRLDRDVAIKMLFPSFAGDPDRVRRFIAEARLAGGLNHSNILAVYDVGDHQGAPFLVSECLEGKTLRHTLEHGPLPLDKALAIALQTARGLAAAHARGIVHRDLKPENVFIKSDGSVKILDFGVAKLLPSTGAPHGDPAETMAGVIVGTAGYMAPEQITGAQLDARADLFAMGAMLYEMLSGQRPFHKSSTVDTLQAVLTSDPPALSSVNPAIPDAVSSVVQRLLQKNADSRFQSAADLAWTLERLPLAPADPPKRTAGGGTTTRFSARSVALMAGTAALIALVTWSFAQLAVSDRPDGLTRFTSPLPAGNTLDSAPAVSPVGRKLALVGLDETGISRIFVRDLAEHEARPIAGSEGAKQPFWSPDGKALGFFARGKLMTVAVDGGAPIAIADARDAKGGAWGQSETIVFQPDLRDAGLSQVSAVGGPVSRVTTLDVAGPDVAHRWPVFLPDGVHFPYYVVSTDDERRGVYLGSTNAQDRSSTNRLFPSSSGAVFVPSPEGGSGLLLTAADRWIEARTFDTAKLAVSDDVRRIEIAAAGAGPHHAGLVGASRDILAFGSSPIPVGSYVATVATHGEGLVIWPGRDLGGFLRLSPDGTRLARTRLDPVRSNPDVWVDDLKRGGQMRLTTSRDLEVLPVWSPGGDRIAFRSGINAAPRLMVAQADGTGPTKTITCPRPYCEPTDWSAGGLIVNVSGGDVWVVPIEDGGHPRPILHETFMERDARISPDGRWIAYVSDESDRAEVSVRSLSGPPRRFIVSTGGGDQPVWRRDGAELFYANLKGILHSVPVRAAAGGGLEFGVPQRLDVPTFGDRHWGTVYDVSPDGRQVFFPHPGNDPFPREIGVVVGWRALLQ